MAFGGGNVKIRSWFIGLGVGVLSLVMAQPSAYGLDEALARLDRGVAVQKALQQVRKAQTDLAVAQAQAGPQLNLSSQGGYQFPLNASGEPQARLKLGLNLPLGETNTTGAALKVAALGLHTALAQLRQTRSGQARQIVRAYGQVLLAEGQQIQARLKLELSQDQVSAAEERQRLGAATLNEVLSAKLAVSTAQQNLTQADFALRDSKLGLARLIGLADLSAVSPLQVLPALPEPQTLRALVAQNPAVELAQIQLEQAQLAAQNAFLQTLPNLNLGLAYTTDRLSTAVNLGFPNTQLQTTLGYQPLGTVQSTTPALNLSVGVSLPLWDSGIASATQQGAALGVEAAQTTLTQTTQDAADLLESALRQAQVDAQDVQTQQAAVQTARQGLLEAEQRLQAGSVTGIEVLAARVQLAVTQGSLLGAQLRVLEDLYLIYSVVGKEGKP